MPEDKSTVKTYMLDSSVLIHDPNAVFAFEENRLLIPTLAIRELKSESKKPGERGFSARTAMRVLMELFSEQPTRSEAVISDADGDISSIMEDALAVADSIPEDIMAEYATCNGVSTMTSAQIPETGGSVALVDGGAVVDILDLAKMYNATLVTKDASTRLIAFARAIHAEDYEHDKCDIDAFNFYTGRSTVYLPSNVMSEIKRGNPFKVQSDLQIYMYDEETKSDVARDPAYRLTENEFLTIKSTENPQSGHILGRYTNGNIVRLEYADSRPFDIEPRNIAQRFAIEALMAPASVAPLVILHGPAGTAKTFLAMACGLQQAYNDTIYRNILVTRPASLLDDTPGYLPGTEQEKVSPLLRSVYDNVDVLMPDAVDRGVGKDGTPPQSPADELIAKGVICVQSMSYMRGRSIRETYVVVDECQNVTPSQLLAIATRTSKDTKLVLLGDENQVDRPSLDRITNGLTFVSTRMKGSPLCWQVGFYEDECERSPLATEAIRLLSVMPQRN